jgi:uncharacterized protein YunC (DUF1805 family)
MDEPLVVDTATRLGGNAAGRVAICGSHGGIYPAWLTAKARVRAAILNDAGVGKDNAGVGGLAWLEKLGIAACTVDHATARIGDGGDMVSHGKVSHANSLAAALGCKTGMPCKEAAQHLHRAHPHTGAVPDLGETRTKIPASGKREVWALDSITLLRADDRRAIVASGTHGGVLGGRADDGIIAVEVFAAFFNDAGGGKDGAGYARLAAIDPRGIAAATVSANTARIGDGRSTYETGVLSRVNVVAKRLGLAEGMGAREAVARLLGLA